MNYYYYPLCSKDFTFENIFSSESISPTKVYEKRGFGADFFYTIRPFHHSEMIVLYNKPPKFSISEPNYEPIKFILKIKEDSLDPQCFILIDEGIVGYPRTIYLGRNNFELLFFSEKEMTIVCMRSEASLLTKSYKKYLDRFKIISENDCIEFKTAMINEISVDNKEIEDTIQFDRKFNSYKGLCYGIATGFSKSNLEREIELKRTLQEITNCFAEFKNKGALEPEFNRSFIKKGSPTKGNNSDAKVFNSIQKSEQLFKELYPGEGYSENELHKYIQQELSKHGFSVNDIQVFLRHKRMEDILLGTTNFVKFKNSYLKNDHSNPALQFELLREILRNYSASLNSYSDWSKISREKASDSFKESVYKLNKFVDSHTTKLATQTKIDLTGIWYNSGINRIEIDQTFEQLNSTIFIEYVTVINIVFANAKRTKGESKKEDMLFIVESVASLLSNGRAGKDSHLYQYLNGEINEYDTNRAQSAVMKNFVAFVFNPDSIEKLENFLNKKTIEKKWMAISFWCCYNGFTNINGGFLNAFFEVNNKITDYLNQFIFDSFNNQNLLKQGIEIDLILPKQDPGDQLDETNNNKVFDFFEKHVANKFKLSFEQFQAVINLKRKDEMIEEFKKKYRMTKKDSVKLIENFDELIKNPSLF
ncbi:MAG: hypothetical protein JST86_09540 [Bacteroidetes bacterium]|nr:hypothetical protein [Bacteroidota bacterium]